MPVVFSIKFAVFVKGKSSLFRSIFRVGLMVSGPKLWLEVEIKVWGFVENLLEENFLIEEWV